jgi:hypothetical protein
VINPRTGIGASVGAFVGFALGGPIGASIGAVLGGATARATGGPSQGEATPKRRLIFTKAVEAVKDPEELRKLADAYAGEGLGAEATTLYKRADLPSLPQAVKESRRIAFRKSMACDDPDAVMKVAIAFQGEGAIDTAKSLRDHADAVRAAHAASKAGKPMIGLAAFSFVDKLGKTLICFGAESNQAKSAARNLIASQGRALSDTSVEEVIQTAMRALAGDAPSPVGLLEAGNPAGQEVKT